MPTKRKGNAYLTRDEEKALLAACNAPKRGHLKPILVAALDTGCRLGELLKLRWSDVDLDNGQINPNRFHVALVTGRSPKSRGLRAIAKRPSTQSP